jgi:hypothetical protein
MDSISLGRAAFLGEVFPLLGGRKPVNRLVLCDYSRVKSSLTAGGLAGSPSASKLLTGQTGEVSPNLELRHWIPEDHENKNIIAISVAAACRFSGCHDGRLGTIPEHSAAKHWAPKHSSTVGSAANGQRPQCKCRPQAGLHFNHGSRSRPRPVVLPLRPRPYLRRGCHRLWTARIHAPRR